MDHRGPLTLMREPRSLGAVGFGGVEFRVKGFRVLGFFVLGFGFRV